MLMRLNTYASNFLKRNKFMPMKQAEEGKEENAMKYKRPSIAN